MLLSVHATVGAIIGEQVSKPIFAFVLGFIAHFILDIVPHGDQALIKAYRNDFKNRGMLYLIFFDLISTIVFILILFYTHRIEYTATVIWGIVGGILPDVMVAIYEITQKHFRHMHKFHHWTHDQVGKKLHWTMSLKLGLLIQLIIIYLLLK